MSLLSILLNFRTIFYIVLISNFFFLNAFSDQKACLSRAMQIVNKFKPQTHSEKLKSHWSSRNSSILSYNSLTIAKVAEYKEWSEFENSFFEMIHQFKKIEHNFPSDLFLKWLKEKEKLTQVEFKKILKDQKELQLGELFYRMYKEYAPHFDLHNPFVRLKGAADKLGDHVTATLRICGIDSNCFQRKVREYIEHRKEASCLFQNPTALSSLIRDYIFTYTAIFAINDLWFQNERFPWDYAFSTFVTSASFVKANCEGIFRTRNKPGSIVDSRAPIKLYQKLQRDGVFRAFKESRVYHTFKKDWTRLTFVALWSNALYVTAREVQDYYQPELANTMDPLERYSYLMLYSMSWAQFRSRMIYEPIKMKFLPSTVSALKDLVGSGSNARKIFLTSTDWTAGMATRFGLSLWSNFEYLEILQKKVMPFLSYHLSESSKKLNGLGGDKKDHSFEAVPGSLWVHYFFNPESEEPRIELEFTDELIEALIYGDIEENIQ